MQIKRATESEYEKTQQKESENLGQYLMKPTKVLLLALSNRDNSISLTTPQASRDFKSLVFFVPT